MENGADAYRRFLEGDENGLEEIITEYKDGLILYLNGYVSNLDLAEELAEDTFVRLFTKKPKNKGGASFKTWLYTIGRNIALDALRKMKRRREEPL
ncbi:MAG: RNA polymerase subunit sigma-24, partial [Clostridia bacterium]|nr:RNA polymerase subunit sigma-24 [Clostridia bacterium]